MSIAKSIITNALIGAAATLSQKALDEVIAGPSKEMEKQDQANLVGTVTEIRPGTSDVEEATLRVSVIPNRNEIASDSAIEIDVMRSLFGKDYINLNIAKTNALVEILETSVRILIDGGHKPSGKWMLRDGADDRLCRMVQIEADTKKTVSELEVWIKPDFKKIDEESRVHLSVKGVGFMAINEIDLALDQALCLIEVLQQGRQILENKR